MSEELSPGSGREIFPYDTDDTLIDATRADGALRVAVYPHGESCAVLGRGGKAEVELNLAAVLADGLTVRRRRGGGCAVVLDRGSLVVSVLLPLPGLGGHRAAFEAISAWLIAALAELGISGVRQAGVSDLTLGDRKIGGSCIYRTKGLLYYSTTLLVDPDMDAVERYISHPPREPEYRGGRRHAEFMLPLRDVAGVERDAGAFAAKLKAALEPGRLRVPEPPRT